MPSAEAMTHALRQYAALYSAGERQAWLDLFIEEPLIIEPADAPPRRGRAPLEEAFDGARSAGLTIRLEPCQIIANGDEAAMHMRVFLTRSDGMRVENGVIEIFSFAPDGRIAQMRAFMDAAQLAPEG